MDSKFFKLLGLDAIIDNVKGYVETRIQLLKLEAQEKIAQIISIILIVACVSFFGALAFLFLNIALAAFLNEVLDSRFLGYLIVGAFYLLVMIILAYNISKGGIHRVIKRKTAQIFVSKKKGDLNK